ncbi:hypothetical protein V2J09_014255 [Rumex salicifolius]
MKILKKLICFLFSILCFNFHISQAQPSTQGYTCTANATNSSYPCQTYVYYRASPAFTPDLATVGDLFSVSRLMISEPSNISSPDSPLIEGQSLLVPISCGCNFVQNLSYSISYSNLTHRIVSGDTFWRVSTYYYGNLTTFQSVEALNPTLIPTNLSIGQDVIFPIFCKCPNQTQLRKGLKWVISYVVQPSDSLNSIASKFSANKDDIFGFNGSSIQPSGTVFVPVSKLPVFSQPVVANSTVPSGVKVEKHKSAVIGLSVGLLVCVILLGLIAGLWVFREKGFKKIEGEENGVLGVKKIKSERMGGGRENWKDLETNLLADVSDSLDKYRVFEIGDLRTATDGFDDKFLIKGSVYRGSIDGQMFAIKKMKWNAYQELKILQMVNHGSLVKLEGFCIDPEDGSCYLVYEYIENGSLFSWLHENNNTEKLSWKTRLRIATDVANGLLYMHEHTRPQVVHKDIKSSNILLDKKMRAKIANFGLAKSGCNAITMHIVGTQGYMSPEYLTDGIVSAKMDVFSFGVVLLELVSGKEAISEEGKVLWASVQGLLDGDVDQKKEMKLAEWMDPVLLNESLSIESLMSVVEVAVSCVSKDPSKRPSMVDVVYTLSKSDDLFFDDSSDSVSDQYVDDDATNKK